MEEQKTIVEAVEVTTEQVELAEEQLVVEVPAELRAGRGYNCCTRLA